MNLDQRKYYSKKASYLPLKTQKMLVFKINYQIICISSTTQTNVSYCNHLSKSCLEEEKTSSTGQNIAAPCFLRASRMLMRIPIGDTGAFGPDGETSLIQKIEVPINSCASQTTQMNTLVVRRGRMTSEPLSLTMNFQHFWKITKEVNKILTFPL